MHIKRINNVVGYKDLPDGFNADFNEYKTYIIGANFQRKTTVGSLFNWCLTGTSLYGKEKEQVANDNKRSKNVIVDITFIDNFGIEHRLIRDKGKEMNLILDGKEIKQEMLAQFYKDKDVFLVAHNPYYFPSLDPKDQKDLIRKILPAISPEDIFELLTESEKNTIGKPIEYLSTYTDNRNQEIDELEKEYTINCGKLQIYKNNALKMEGESLIFDKEDILQQLQERYDAISMDLGNYNLEDTQRSISRINERLEDLIKNKLSNITETYNKEKSKLKSIDDEKSICPSCKQEIKDNEVKDNLKIFYKKELDKLQEKANILKVEAKELITERKNKEEIFNKLNTSTMQELQIEKQNLKLQIDALLEEKNNILLHNQEVQIKHEQIKEAKKNIEILGNAQKEIMDRIEKNKTEKAIANKLKRLVIEQQKQLIDKFLNKVDIQFTKENKTNSNITECCNIQYEGRDYKKLSKSQQARACLEISNVFNNISGIKAPIFFDDAESTTDIQEMKNTQVIISLVIKYNKLEILYDYEDVLDRKKKSIEREIDEKSEFLIEQAA